jgi:hypothetical protein
MEVPALESPGGLGNFIFSPRTRISAFASEFFLAKLCDWEPFNLVHSKRTTSFYFTEISQRSTPRGNPGN